MFSLGKHMIFMENLCFPWENQWFISKTNVFLWKSCDFQGALVFSFRNHMISIWKPVIFNWNHVISKYFHALCECRPSGWCLAFIFQNKTMSFPTRRILFSRKENLYLPFWKTIFVLTTEFAGCWCCAPNPESDLLNLDYQIQGHQLAN